MFRGYRRPDWLEPEEPFLEVLSWQTWKELLEAGGEIWDEYGVRVPTEKFIADVENTDPANRRRHYDWTQENRRLNYAGTSIDTDWLDSDGFSFYDGEFC